MNFPRADLLRGVFEFDVLACADCGGCLRLVATIENPSVVARILEHLGLAVDPPSPAPARSTEYLPGCSDSATEHELGGGIELRPGSAIPVSTRVCGVRRFRP